MGFEVKYIFHPRKEEGGYDTEIKEEKLVKIGKPFDDTPMEKLAAGIMAQLARRDVWVVDVEVSELVKKQVAFKESKDGKGIILKGKRYSFNAAAEMIQEEEEEENLFNENKQLQPHELIKKNKNIVQNKPKQNNKILYKVFFDPAIQYIPEINRQKLKLTQDKEYSVHKVVPHPTGKLEMQRIEITDDSGSVVSVEEKYFSRSGTGLLADKQLNFSGGTGNNFQSQRGPKLMFEDELVMEVPQNTRSSCAVEPSVESMPMPDIRAKH